jgi:hypothetical protein
MIEHNKQLSNFINQSQSAIENSTNPQELVDIIEKARIFNGNFKYNHKDILIYFSTALSCWLISALLLITHNHGFWLATLLISTFSIAAIIKAFFKRGKNINDLADAIFWKDLYFDNHIQNSKDEQYKITALKERFNDFNRGNYSQSIRTLVQGNYKSHNQTYNYYYYNFHYVDERIVESTDSDGKKTEEKVYEHYDRYGIILPYTIAENVRIIENNKLFGQNKSDYEPASLSFRKLFVVKTNDIFQASKLLSPSMVEYLEALPNNYNNIVLELKTNELLLSFTNKYTLSAKREYNFNQLEKFLEEVREVKTLPRLKHLHSVCDFFVQNTQNNFD